MTGGWHPKVRAVHENWSRLRNDGLLPSRADFDPVAMPALLPSICLIDVQADPQRFRYRLIGTAIVPILGAEYTGRWLDECMGGFESSDFSNALKAVARDGQPCHFRGISSFRFSRDVAEIEHVILPLARDGRNVDMILGSFVFFDQKGQEIGLPKR